MKIKTLKIYESDEVKEYYKGSDGLFFGRLTGKEPLDIRRYVDQNPFRFSPTVDNNYIFNCLMSDEGNVILFRGIDFKKVKEKFNPKDMIEFRQGRIELEKLLLNNGVEK